jgi:dihydrofolate reductase
MSRVVVINHLTLDGVMQSPGRPDEDTRGGFERGGWAGPNVDEVVNAAMAARMPQSGGLLLGRRSYEDMLSYWNTQDSPFKDMLNSGPKYVASRTLHNLIDEFLLLIHPLVLGAGRRLFGDGDPPASLRLVDSTVSTTGVLIATYQPDERD